MKLRCWAFGHTWGHWYDANDWTPVAIDAAEEAEDLDIRASKCTRCGKTTVQGVES